MKESSKQTKQVVLLALKLWLVLLFILFIRLLFYCINNF